MAPATKWYQDVTTYQWLVVLIASVGWVFDAFEGQLFNVQKKSKGWCTGFAGAPINSFNRITRCANLATGAS